jgi:hypothetical protein
MAGTDHTCLRTAEVGAREKSTDNSRYMDRTSGAPSADVPPPGKSGPGLDIDILHRPS